MGNLIKTHLEVEVWMKGIPVGKNICVVDLKNVEDKCNIIKNKRNHMKVKHNKIFIDND